MNNFLESIPTSLPLADIRPTVRKALGDPTYAEDNREAEHP